MRRPERALPCPFYPASCQYLLHRSLPSQPCRAQIYTCRPPVWFDRFLSPQCLSLHIQACFLPPTPVTLQVCPGLPFYLAQWSKQQVFSRCSLTVPACQPSFLPDTYLYWFISFPLVSWVLSFLIRILRIFMKKMKLICKGTRQKVRLKVSWPWPLELGTGETPQPGWQIVAAHPAARVPVTHKSRDHSWKWHSLLSGFSGPRVYTMAARSLTLGACNPL